jgi:hypothetical protein
MVTVWPLDDGTLSNTLNTADLKHDGMCRRAVLSIDLVASRNSIVQARTALRNTSFDDKGPYVIAWSPARSFGKSQAAVLVLNLSNVTTGAQAVEMFREWSEKIEQNPELKIIAVDAFGSVLKKYHETGIYDENEIYSYRIEGTGKNIIPANLDFGLVDRFVKVTDKDSALRARAIARQEGMLVGYSSGGALQCLEQIKSELTADDVVVLIFADHGSKYVSKIFNDSWMEAQGFLEPSAAAVEA